MRYCSFYTQSFFSSCISIVNLSNIQSGTCNSQQQTDMTNHFAFLRGEPWMLSADPLLQAHLVTPASAARTEVRCLVTGTRVQLVRAFWSPHGTARFPARGGANGNETSKTNTKSLKDKGPYSCFKLHKPTMMFMEET